MMMKKTYLQPEVAIENMELEQPEVAIENMELEQMIAASGDLLIDIDKDTTGDPSSADSRLFEDFLF